jgi:hypothetical protein
VRDRLIVDGRVQHRGRGVHTATLTASPADRAMVPFCQLYGQLASELTRWYLYAGDLTRLWYLYVTVRSAGEEAAFAQGRHTPRLLTRAWSRRLSPTFPPGPTPSARAPCLPFGWWSKERGQDMTCSTRVVEGGTQVEGGRALADLEASDGDNITLGSGPARPAREPRSRQ